MTRSWSQGIGAFTQYFGSEALDASSLLMPLMRFVSPTDRRMVSTIRAICRQLMMGSLLLRYEIGTAADDGLTGREGYFTACALWLVEAMARAGFAEGHN